MKNAFDFHTIGWGHDMFFDFSSDTCYGKLYGLKFVLGLVA